MSRFREALEAWHGTHADDIQEFDDDKVGTGEGAQVYGWGHYAGQARGTGEDYMRSVSRKRLGSEAGGYYFDAGLSNPVPFSQLLAHESRGNVARVWRILEEIQQHNNLPDLSNSAKKTLMQMIQTAHDTYADQGPSLEYQLDYAKDMYDEMLADGYDPSDEEHREAKQFVDRDHPVLEKWVQAAKEHSGGRLYELRIHTGDHELLDWEEGLKNHHPEVLKKIQPFLGQLKSGTDASGYNPYTMKYGTDFDNLKGEDFYKHITTMLGNPKDASKALLAAGIHGIKYKDQFSRNLKPRVFVGDTVLDASNIGRNGLIEGPADGGPGVEPLYNALDRLNPEKSNHDDLVNVLGYLGSYHSGIERKRHLAWAEWVDKNRDKIDIRTPKPTYNYVVFDPTLIKIVRKYDSRGTVLHDYTQAHGTDLRPVDHDPFKEK